MITKSKLLLTSVTAAMLLPSVAWSQLEEIVVTAERRSASIQDVAISVQAFSADALDAAVITEPVQLGEIVPGLQYSKQTGQANPYIRGVGTQNTAVGDESTVATYVDGVYIMGMQAAATSFNNIERIEVLKGPQGTLFGRNTTGGLIHIVTKDPVHDATAKIGISYADYDTLSGNFYGSIGVSDNVATDLSVYVYDQGEGFGTNLVTGNDVNKTEDFVIRNKWLIEVGDDLTMKLAFDYAKTKSDIASARQPIEGEFGIDGAFVFAGCLAQGAGPAACTAAAQTFGTGYSGDFHDIQANAESPSEAEQMGASLHFTKSMENFDIVSITAYRDTTVDALLDQDGIALQILDATLDREEDQFSQEIQLVSTTDNGYSWIVGGFFMDAEASYTPFELAGIGLPLLAPGVTFLHSEVSQTLKSMSVFAQGSYDLSDKLSLTAGLRWTKDERELDGVTTISFGALDVPIAFSEKAEFDEVTARLALDYQVTDDMMAYISYNRGFKSGLFNSIVSSGMPDPAVDPEFIDAYEIGLKSDWLDGRLRANFAAYYYDYKDIQLQFVNAGTTILGNAASAEIKGVEIELQASVSDNLNLRFGASMMDAEYKDYPNAPISTSNDAGFGPFGGNSVGFGDVSGNKMARAPDLTVSIGANYLKPVSSNLEFGANINWYYNDGFFWFEDNRIMQESYDVVNAELSIGQIDGKWKVRLWAKNLTDSEYSIFTNSGQFGDLTAAAAPRVVGVGFDYEF